MSKTSPSLLDIVEVWLAKNGLRDWSVSDSSKYTKELIALNPWINLNTVPLGSLTGWGWIFTIYPTDISSFQTPFWGDWCSEKSPLKASDPEFFNKLKVALDSIKDMRNGDFDHRKSYYAR